mmetsp:Transcript_32047/g.67817  ORF Transcript_32047/g.67817 Transcript_32047/m.67817 type:complete len:306 (-) Transcript_32047:95-1012(-)
MPPLISNSWQQSLHLPHKIEPQSRVRSQWCQLSFQACQYWRLLKDQPFLNGFWEQWLEQTNKCLQNQWQIQDHCRSGEARVETFVLITRRSQRTAEALIRCLSDPDDVIGKDDRAHSARFRRSFVGNDIMHLLGVKEKVTDLFHCCLVHQLLVIDLGSANDIHQIAILRASGYDRFWGNVVIDNIRVGSSLANHVVIPPPVRGSFGHRCLRTLDDVFARRLSPLHGNFQSFLGCILVVGMGQCKAEQIDLRHFHSVGQRFPQCIDDEPIVDQNALRLGTDFVARAGVEASSGRWPSCSAIDAGRE